MSCGSSTSSLGVKPCRGPTECNRKIHSPSIRRCFVPTEECKEDGPRHRQEPGQDTVTLATAAEQHCKQRSNVCRRSPHRDSTVMDRSSVNHLAGVKHTLYHPRLPTLRRMEMDSMAHKLSDEHSRSSTPCDHRSFTCARMNTYNHERHVLPSPEITDTGRRLTQRRADSNMVAQLLKWTPEKETICVLTAKDKSMCSAAPWDLHLSDLRRMDLGFDGYAVRFLSPIVPRSWRFCLGHNPTLDEYGQKPVPVETMSIFRTPGPAYR